MNEARQDDYIWHSFHLYKILENDPIFSDKKQIGVWGTGWGHHHLYCPGSQKGQREFSKVMSVHYFDCGDGFTYVKTHQNVCFSCMQYEVYKKLLEKEKETNYTHGPEHRVAKCLVHACHSGRSIFIRREFNSAF